MGVLKIEDIIKRLIEGLEYTNEQIQQIKKWLLEFQLANQMSLKELDEFCWADSNWIFNQVFA